MLIWRIHSVSDWASRPVKHSLFFYQFLLRLANFGFKILCFVVVSVAVCGAQAAEKGGWQLKAFGFLLLLWGGLLLPHHLAVGLCTRKHIYWIRGDRGCRCVPSACLFVHEKSKILGQVTIKSVRKQREWLTHHRQMMQIFSQVYQGTASHSRLLLPTRSPHLKHDTGPFQCFFRKLSVKKNIYFNFYKRVLKMREATWMTKSTLAPTFPIQWKGSSLSCVKQPREQSMEAEMGKYPFNVTLFYSSVAAYEIKANMTFNLSLTVSFISAGVAWFILIAEKGWRQQQFFGQRCLFSSWLPHKHNFHIRVLVHASAGWSRLRHYDTSHRQRKKKTV